MRWGGDGLKGDREGGGGLRPMIPGKGQKMALQTNKATAVVVSESAYDAADRDPALVGAADPAVASAALFSHRLDEAELVRFKRRRLRLAPSPPSPAVPVSAFSQPEDMYRAPLVSTGLLRGKKLVATKWRRTDTHMRGLESTRNGIMFC